jgi:hypothetical protein
MEKSVMLLMNHGFFQFKAFSFIARELQVVSVLTRSWKDDKILLKHVTKVHILVTEISHKQSN